MMKIRSQDANRLSGLNWHWGGFGIFLRRSDRFVITSNRNRNSLAGMNSRVPS